jgi:hypothetical protein
MRASSGRIFKVEIMKTYLRRPIFLLLSCLPSCTINGRGQSPDSVASSSEGENPGADETSKKEPIDPNQPQVDNVGEITPGSDAYVGEDSHSKKCPEAAPEIGSNCGAEAHFCQYGNSVRYDCRRQVYCGPQGWSELPSQTCERPPADFCPGNIPEEGRTCDPWEGSQHSISFASGSCEYGDGSLCGCFALEGRGEWRCTSPPAAAACPSIAPNFGTVCSDHDQECTYGDHCTTGAHLICKEGIWSPLEGGGICAG